MTRFSARAAVNGAAGVCNQTGFTSSTVTSGLPAAWSCTASSRSPQQIGL